MAGTRVRCICGTVFDPSKKQACPACGTKHTARRAVSSRNAAPSPLSSASSPPIDEPIRGDGATGFGRGEPSYFAQHKTLVIAGGGVGGFLLMALLVRLIFGGTDVPKESKRAAAVATRTTDVPMREEGVTPSSEQAPSPSSTTPSPNTPSPVSPVPRTENPPYVPPAVPSEVPSFRGTWRRVALRTQPEPNIPGVRASESAIGQAVTAAFIGPAATASMTIDEHGNYRMDIEVTGDGQFAANITPNENLHSVSADGVLTLSPKGALLSDRARVMLKPVRMDMPEVNAKAGDMQMVLSPADRPGTMNITFIRSADSFQSETSVAGTWSHEPIFVDSYMGYRAALELRDNGDYQIRFSRSEGGALTAAGGNYEFKRSVRMGPELKGRYEFEGPNRFTLSEPRGTAIWVREDVNSKGQIGGGRRTRR